MIELLTANTPNGKKISIMLEEINYEYKLTKIDISSGEQFNPKLDAPFTTRSAFESPYLKPQSISNRLNTRNAEILHNESFDFVPTDINVSNPRVPSSLMDNSKGYEYLKSIGAKNITKSSDLDKDPRPLDKGIWDGAVDTVGGNILSNILPHIKENGIVAAVGNASGIKLNTTVMPFIIRGVKLWGIDSVHTSSKRREFLWGEASNLINFDLLEQSVQEINLEGLLDVFPKMLKGETSGRYIVDVNK